jgi:hypothetical protein
MFPIHHPLAYKLLRRDKNSSRPPPAATINRLCYLHAHNLPDQKQDLLRQIGLAIPVYSGSGTHSP